MIATIDFETTGLKAGEDEVLQVSIIDENYNVLLNVYCRPNNKGSWEDAQAVHGITPLMVANELPFERYVPTVLDILSKADKVIAYNAAFEDSYLKAYGIEVDPEKWIDPMIMFAEIYGEWNERRGSYKWQSLTKCATYYGYEFKAHDSLEWSNLIYKVDADGEIESTTYVCAKCGVVHTEVEWKEHFNEGRYVAKYPNRKVRGFHFNSLASTFFGWDKIVKGFIEADQALKKGNIELMKSWVNTELGQTWEEQGEKASKDDLLKRRERYRCEVPDEVIAITAGIDTQDDRFEVEVVGWGVEHESYGIIYKRIYGDLKQSEVWKNLDDFLKQTFKKADGTAMRISCACMDSGGHFTNKVYRFCKARTARKIFAIKGGNEGTARPYISKPTKNNREQAYLFTLGVDTGKSLLLQRLQIEEEGPGYCHFPKDENEYIRGYDEDYFKGLTAEKQVLKYKKGRPYFVWELTGETKRNEPLDCRNYAQAAIEITGLTLKEPPKKKTEVQVTRKQTRRRGNRSGGIA